MGRFLLTKVHDNLFQDDVWMIGEPGEINTQEQVEDCNLQLGMSLAEQLFSEGAPWDTFDGRSVFHVIHGEGYFNSQNHKMARRLMKDHVPFILISWRKS